MLKVQARLSTIDGKGVGRWRDYFNACEDLRDAAWFARDLVPSCQVRVLDGKAVVFGPCRARELQALYTREEAVSTAEAL
jgi:hypothetical protein